MTFKQRFLRGFPGILLGALAVAIGTWQGDGLWFGVLLPLLVCLLRAICWWNDRRGAGPAQW